MDAEKFTKKSLEVIESCEKLAYEYNNQELTQAHLMYALVTVEDSLIAKLLTNMGINMDAFTGECETGCKPAEGIGRTVVYKSGIFQGIDSGRKRSKTDG